MGAARYECTPGNRRSSSVHRCKHCNSITTVFFPHSFQFIIPPFDAIQFKSSSKFDHIRRAVWGLQCRSRPESPPIKRAVMVAISMLFFSSIQFRCERVKQIENSYRYRKQTTSLLILQRTFRYVFKTFTAICHNTSNITTLIFT
jgi:hypothetical protein